MPKRHCHKVENTLREQGYRLWNESREMYIRRDTVL